MNAPRRKTARRAPRRTSRRPVRARSRSRRATQRSLVPTSFDEIGESARETTRSLWLAGLGLAATTMETAEGAFGALVARGKQREPKTLTAAKKVIREARRTANDLATDAARASKKKLDEALDAFGVDQRARPKNLFHRLGDLAEAIL